MVFSDPVFLFAFFPACLLAYWLGGWRFRNLFIALVGSVFYMWGGGSFIVLLFASITINHLAAVKIFSWKDSEPKKAQWLKRSVIAANLVALALWKYGGFAVHQFSNGLNQIGIDANFELSLALPIAISFFTFQSMSYVIDVSRGDAKPAPRLLDYATYIVLFPHLIAGPIVRYSHIEPDLLRTPRNRLDDFVAGAPRFFWGLGKKILVADQVAAIANHAFALPDNRVTWAVAWIGALSYAIQIYFDFSGYSDMAIGLARMFGFDFPENFDHPYGAVSITDFWRRWHISLSSWFRDYLYIPLGGNRKGPSRTYINLACVFLLTGLWHGANWTFIAWGIFHGSFLIIERFFGLNEIASNWTIPLRRLVTFAIVCVGWTLFRADNIDQGFTFVKSMLWPSGLSWPATLSEVMTDQRLVWLVVGLVVVFLPVKVHIGRDISRAQGTTSSILRFGAIALVGPIATIYALSSTFSPFLYFKF
jgi:alginate O-acetyltransferase complex protein AlgI